MSTVQYSNKNTVILLLFYTLSQLVFSSLNATVIRYLYSSDEKHNIQRLTEHVTSPLTGGLLIKKMHNIIIIIIIMRARKKTRSIWSLRGRFVITGSKGTNRAETTGHKEMHSHKAHRQKKTKSKRGIKPKIWITLYVLITYMTWNELSLITPSTGRHSPHVKTSLGLVS